MCSLKTFLARNWPLLLLLLWLLSPASHCFGPQMALGHLSSKKKVLCLSLCVAMHAHNCQKRCMASKLRKTCTRSPQTNWRISLATRKLTTHSTEFTFSRKNGARPNFGVHNKTNLDNSRQISSPKEQLSAFRLDCPTRGALWHVN